MQRVRALLVSDGATAGATVAAVLGADPGIAVVARSVGIDAAVAALTREQPDVIVLFGHPGGGEGRTRLEKAASTAGCPVVATDSNRTPSESLDSLCRRVKAAAPCCRGRAGDSPAPLPARAAAAIKLVALGASTGGVEALIAVLSRFPAACPPTVVVQHMPPFFTTSFAARLDGICPATVHEAWDGAPLERGVIYLAPGGATHLEVVWSAARKVRLVESEPVNRHRPSVDVAFRSVARQLGTGSVGVLLTGMGRDGAEGLLAMREAGARTIAQDRDSSTVYGMPRAALECGAVDAGTPLSQIAAAIFDPDPQIREVSSWR